MYQVYLVAYSHSRGIGRTFNYRNDNQPPSVNDIESIERKISEKNGVNGVCVTGIYRLEDTEEIDEEAS